RARYREQGFLFPVPLIAPAGAHRYRQAMEGFEAAQGKQAQQVLRQKCYLALRWAYELVSNSALLDAVEGLIGPDILCWSTSFFIKEARDPRYVSWHQDPTYWNLDDDELVSAWIALTPSTVENGCLRVLPGTHRGRLAHIDTEDPKNYLTRGQTLVDAVDESKAVPVELQPGEAALFHVLTAHGSPPNPSDQRRIGFAIRYIPTSAAPDKGAWDSAMLVRGEDKYGHFELEPPPAGDGDPASMAYLEYILSKKQGGIYRQGKMLVA
ncbi:MAG: phytanoyl-CoA dioxygenase family protein, partial [Alphaproteobacteria bacterium]